MYRGVYEQNGIDPSCSWARCHRVCKPETLKPWKSAQVRESQKQSCNFSPSCRTPESTRSSVVEFQLQMLDFNRRRSSILQRNVFLFFVFFFPFFYLFIYSFPLFSCSISLVYCSDGPDPIEQTI